jgi:hypothetical protein
MESCRYCGYGGGEHSKECPKYTAEAKQLAELNRRKTLKGAGNDNYRGTQFEYDIFGEVDTRDPRYAAELKKMGVGQNTYLPFAKSVELVKKFQPSDPTDPKKDFLRELRLAIIGRLGIEDDDAMDAIGVYTAVGTPLDKFHGVDAFVSETADGNETIVTLDATLRPEKIAEGGKADIIIGDMPSPEEDEDAYLKAVESYAERIVARLERLREPKAA